MPTSSANPANLDIFVVNAGQATNELGSQVFPVQTLYDDFQAASFAVANASDPTFFGNLSAYIAQNGADEQWVKAIHDLFVGADTDTLPDSFIDLSLQLSGISDTPSAPLTIDSPVLSGLPINSGFTDDPICTATGHFVESEFDFVMPTGLQPLQWPRVYNSRFIIAGAFGRGWSSWADTTLRRQGRTLRFRGPDGQVAVWILDGDQVVPMAGLGVDVVQESGTVELHWHGHSRHRGAVWTFDDTGALVTVVPTIGGATRLVHGDGRLLAMEHEGGRSLELDWDGDRIVSVRSSDGRRADYAYEGGDLKSAWRPGGTNSYRTDDLGHLVELVDGDDVRLVRNEYDGQGRVLRQESPFGRITSLQYLGGLTTIVGDTHDGPSTLYRHDQAGRLTELVTAVGSRYVRDFDDDGNMVRSVGFEGGVTERSFDGHGNCLFEQAPDGSTQSWAYDQRGRVVEHTDPVGALTVFTYDDDGALPTAITGPLGAVTSYRRVNGLVVEETDPDGVKVRSERNGDGSLIALVDGEGNRTGFERHPSGAISAITLPTGERFQFEVDDAGRVVAAVTPAGDQRQIGRSDGGRALWAVDYDGARCELRWGAHGQLSEVVDAMGRTTTLEFDSRGQLVGGSQPGGARWEFGYDQLGQATSISDPTGETWKQSWSPGGTFLGITDPLGNEPTRRLDVSGRAVTMRTPGGHEFAVERDAAGRLVSATADGGTCTMEYDACGRLVRETDPVGRESIYTYTPGNRLATLVRRGARWALAYDRCGRLSSVTGPGPHETVIGYDGSGRIIAITWPDGSVRRVRWGPQGHPVEVDEAGVTTRYDLDPRGRVTAVRQGDQVLRRITYDPAGLPVSLTDGLGRTTTIDRDERGNRVGITGPDGASWTSELDLLGRPVGVVDPIGERVVLGRDAAGRVVSRAAAGEVLASSLSPDGELVGLTAAGLEPVVVDRDFADRRVVVTAGASGRAEFTYDGVGRLVHRDIAGRVTTWTYDDDGRAFVVGVPDGGSIVTRLDEAGRLVGLSHAAIGDVELMRDPVGRPAALEAGGIRRSWTYDQGRMVGYSEEVGASRRDYILDYDDHGNVVSESSAEHRRSYRYDAAGQLVAMEEGGATWQWTYDESGRLTDEQAPSGQRRFAYNGAGELVEEAGDEGTVRFHYDSMGRRVEEQRDGGVTTYRRDALGRLTGVSRQEEGAGSSIELELDPVGELAAIDGQPVDWPATAGKPLAFGGATILEAAGSPVASVVDGAVRWISCDWRGDVGGQFGPWGPLGGATGLPQDPGSLGYLGELGIGPLVWLHRRVYDTSTHAFLERDPLFGPSGIPGECTNPYQFAANNPLVLIDPSGLKPISMSDYQSMAQAEANGHWAQALVVVAAVAVVGLTGGAALSVILPAILPAIVIGGVAGAAGTAISEAVSGQPLDPGNILMGGLVGAAVGGVVGTGGVVAAVAGVEGLGAMAYGGALGVAFGGAASVASQTDTAGPVDDRQVGIDAVAAAIPGGEGWLRPIEVAAGVTPIASGADGYLGRGQDVTQPMTLDQGNLYSTTEPAGV